jgi:hypothetical protein
MPWVFFALCSLALVGSFFELRRLDTPGTESPRTAWFLVVRGETCSHRQAESFAVLQGWRTDVLSTHAREQQLFRVEAAGFAFEAGDFDQVFEIFLQQRLLNLRLEESFGLRLFDEGSDTAVSWQLGLTLAQGRQGEDVWYFAAERPFPCDGELTLPVALPALTDALASARTREDLKEKLVRELKREVLARVD